jgi:hypothetical protein
LSLEEDLNLLILAQILQILIHTLIIVPKTIVLALLFKLPGQLLHHLVTEVDDIVV